MLCLRQAEDLLGVPVDTYDLWAGNFLISNKPDPITGLPKPYYIDQDIPTAIAQHSYSTETVEDRRATFERDLSRMR